ncbi:RAP protein, putative [Plasmodium gallinaceum]|uniref:RAP protein, putative n=1 Tax=Plasmodium gallinaceum TaxID=5849 RepID=A0A1J1GQK0_PLAGA|nr:RAP protein, putative [Plasmodium gallinaceum]CRG94731.1 RAP protein, putative [Plasmodium gallinaceum]
MLKVYNLTIKLNKKCEFYFKKNFSIKKEDTLKAIKINKEIIKSSNVLEIIKIIKVNGKNANIINYVTFFHRLMQIINKNNIIYLKNKKYIDAEIEEKIKVFFKYLNDNKNIKKINNYNKRLFSSFLWSFSKYLCLLNENKKNLDILNNLKNCNNKNENTKFFQNNEENENTFKDNDNRSYKNIYENNLFLRDYDKCNKRKHTLCKDLNYKNYIKTNEEKENSLFIRKYNEFNLNKHYLFNIYDINLLYRYANVYLSSLNPSRYVIVIWSLSKLNKDNKEIHEKYWKRSLSLIPSLKKKEIIILLYSYSYVNFSNFYFYMKIKNFIIEKKIYKKIINEKNYESIINMLLAYSNQNIFFADLFERTINYMLKTKLFFNSLKNKELITLLFCICKCPFLYMNDENKYNILKKNLLKKNILLYELLKKKIMKRCNLKNLEENVQIYKSIDSINKKTTETKTVNIFTLENIIIIIWSLSLKYIYSAKLFLYSFIKINNLIKNENGIYNNYHILTNFYLSFLSFILDDETYINLYFNKEEKNSLSILNDNINIFMNNFDILKKSINMNQRKNNVEISNMQKSIFFLVKNFEWSKNVNTILEYKNPLNISIDILLYKKIYSSNDLNGIKKLKEQKIINERNEKCKHMNNTDNINRNISNSSIIYNNNRFNIFSIKNKNLNRIPFYFFLNTKGYFSTNFHNKSDKIRETSETLHKQGLIVYSKKKTYSCIDNNNNDNNSNDIVINLYQYIERMKNLNLKYTPNELQEIYKDLLSFFNTHFKYIRKCDVISFFYKFSSFFVIFYDIKCDMSLIQLFKIFAFYHNFTFSVFKKKEKIVNLFIDTSWTYFRYIKYLKFLSEKTNTNKILLKELGEIKLLLSEEINIVMKIFNIIKKKIIEENILNDISSKNMTLLISIFLYVKDSEDIISYLKRNNFNNVTFSIKDITFILRALSKCEIACGIENFFCKKFVENMENCKVKDLVEFTYLCAELKINNDFIRDGITRKIISDVYLRTHIEEKESKLNKRSNDSDETFDKSSNFCKLKFIEIFQHDQLAFFIRNCYRMHCFDKKFFDLLCDTTLKKYSDLDIKSLCIILPCFARIYCLHKYEDSYPEKEIEKKKNKMKIKKEYDNYLEKRINNCKYNIPLSLKKLIKYSEKKVINNKNISFYNLCYYMEAITLLKIENKNLYNLSIRETLKKIQNFSYNEKEVKLLGKILWCLSYYHKTEFLFSIKITNFILDYKIYENVIPENFISIFSYYIKSKVYNKKLFKSMGEIILLNISLNDYFSKKEKKKKFFKLNVVTELYATMSWAYAFTFCNMNIIKNEKEEKKKSISNNLSENDSIFIEKIYNYIFNEIKILQNYENVSFLLLARFFWGISVANLINQNFLNFLNIYKWNDIKIDEQNAMHLHMIYILWLRIKYCDSNFEISNNFLQFKDKIILLFKKKNISKRNIIKNNISNFHRQISHILDKFNVKYENEHITEDFLSIDIIIKNENFPDKIAIEVDGPSHHLLLLDDINNTNSQNIKKQYIKCGTTYFKTWLLEKSGWVVINIPSYKWNKLSNKDKNNYLIQKLSSSSKYLKNFFEKYKEI